MNWIEIVPPADEPVSVEEARAHLEAQPYFDSDTDPVDDALIIGWIGAAREQCEDFLGLSLALRTLEMAPDSFPARACGARTDPLIELPMGPVREVLSVRWGDESDEALGDDQFVLDRYRKPNALAAVSAWPVVSSAPNRVKIRYIAGYGADSDHGDMPLPRAIRAAMLLIVGHLCEHRSEGDDIVVTTIPNGVEALLRPKRVRLGMA